MHKMCVCMKLALHMTGVGVSGCVFYRKMVLLVSVVNATPGPVHPYFQFDFVFVAVVPATRHLEVNVLMSG